MQNGHTSLVQQLYIIILCLIYRTSAKNEECLNEGYVIGGDSAQPCAWPWQGSLEKNGKHHCGAILLSEEWALSAAHCVDDQNYYSVVFGMHDRYDWSVGKPRRYMVVSQVKHPAYAGSNGYDAVLLRLSPSVNLWLNIVEPVRLASRVTLGSHAIVTGWGATESTDSSQVLQEAAVVILPEPLCLNWWPHRFSPSNMLCAYGQNGRNTCGGDSGGPLVTKDDDGWILVGVTSFGARGCDPTVPSVYTSVASLRPWITSVTGVLTYVRPTLAPLITTTTDATTATTIVNTTAIPHTTISEDITAAVIVQSSEDVEDYDVSSTPLPQYNNSHDNTTIQDIIYEHNNTDNNDTTEQNIIYMYNSTDIINSTDQNILHVYSTDNNNTTQKNINYVNNNTHNYDDYTITPSSLLSDNNTNDKMTSVELQPTSTAVYHDPIPLEVKEMTTILSSYTDKNLYGPNDGNDVTTEQSHEDIQEDSEFQNDYFAYNMYTFT